MLQLAALALAGLVRAVGGATNVILLMPTTKAGATLDSTLTSTAIPRSLTTGSGTVHAPQTWTP